MAAPEEPSRQPEAPPAASQLAPGALSALLQRLAEVPVTDPAGTWGPLPDPGSVIGRFELVREIGRGGFGVVYEARDRELPRSVAFKLVRPGRIDRGEDLLRREGDAIAQLSHPNLVTLFDVGRCEHGPYLILELLRGETLDQRLRRGVLAPQEAIEVASQIARGMGHAHARGVVHRDLKPSNVFLCEGGAVKLLDFGMSHAFGRQRLSGGTPGYMAPEQWRHEPEDQRTDVYALGVILFEMLTGQRPFPDDAHGEAVLSPLPAPRVSVPDAPGLSTLVRHMLEKAPERRPAGAAAVLEALEAARRAPARARVRLRLLRRPWALVLAGALATLLVVVLWRLRPPTGAAAPPRAIAVLPFAHVDGGAEADGFGAGLTQELLHRLTRVRDLRVASGATSLALQGSRGAAPELTRRLGVDLLLEGSVRRDKDRLRISAELVDAQTGYRLWSQIYDRRLADGFAAQEDVARQVVGALELVMAGPLRRDLAQPSGESLAAYDLYLKGRTILAQPAGDVDLADATRLFEQAIATDATFAVAFAGLCDAWLARYKLSRAAASFAEAERACRTALEKEPQAAEVHESTGRLFLASGDAAQAERELSEAAGLAANPVPALLGLARAHEALGRLADAEADLARARAADPNDWRIPSQLGAILFRSGRADEAARAYAEVTARTPESPDAHAHLGAALLMAGDFAAATAVLERSVALGPSQVALSNLGSAAFYQGRFEASAGWFRRAAEAAPDDHELWGNLGDALTFWPGHATEAAEAYRRAVPLAERQLSINRADAYTRAALARYQARLGQAGRARRSQEEALQDGGRDMYVQYNAALVSLQLGAPDEALAALERAVALGYQRRLLAPDAALAPLRGRPGFAALTAAAPQASTQPRR